MKIPPPPDSAAPLTSMPPAPGNAAVVTEYGHLHGSGYLLRDEVAGRYWPLAEWIEDKRDNGGRVFRRRVIVVEDWEEVTGL